MKGRHRADLVWRFQHAEEHAAEVPSGLAVLADVCMSGPSAWDEQGASLAETRVSERERRDRIDAALRRLPTTPVRLARVLFLRYGLTDALPEIRLVLREHAAIATMTAEAARWFARIEGEAAGARAESHDVTRWLGAICGRIGTREARGEDTMVIDEVRRGARALLEEAESAYEATAEGRSRVLSGRGRTTKGVKAFYTLAELASALGISRWTMRRWLDARGIPYELQRRRAGTRGGRIVVMVSELRTYAPSYFSSVREELEVECRQR